MNADYDNDLRDDGIQHGIDDNPHNDPQKGAVIGGLGGVAVGAAAGAALGPVGAVIGAAIGGVAGAAASGAAVAAIDDMDDDDTVTGLHTDHDNTVYDRDTVYDTDRPMAASTMPYDNTATYDNADYATRGGNVPGTAAHDDTLGYQTASHTAETLTGDPRPISTQTAAPVEGALGGNQIPGIQTGGHAIDGTPDTRGLTEKAADAVTGDKIDDKTGRRIDY